MEFVKKVEPEVITYLGKGHFGVSGGKHLKIETTPGGEEILNEKVPSGKKWIVTISLAIVESEE